MIHLNKGKKISSYLDDKKNILSETEFRTRQLELIFWMEKAGKGSTKDFKYWLATSFYKEKDHFPKDWYKGDIWCLKAAKLGHIEAQERYVNILKQNGIVPTNYTMKWYSSQNRDLKAKHEYLLAKSFLSSPFKDSISQQVYNTHGIKWLKRSAKLGYFDAQCDLAAHFEDQHDIRYIDYCKMIANHYSSVESIYENPVSIIISAALKTADFYFKRKIYHESYPYFLTAANLKSSVALYYLNIFAEYRLLGQANSN